MKIMKKIPVIMTLCVAAAVCGGCATESTKEYDELNAKLNLNYSQIVLTVNNTVDEGSVLTSEYTMKFTEGEVKVNYSVERFAEVSLDSATTGKTTVVGEAKIADGKVTYVSGENVNLDVLKTGTGLNFKKEYFNNIDLTGIYLIADVTNPTGFMGSPLTCSEMKVRATFLEVFFDIRISYLAQSGNSVEYIYNFSL